jgi:hypothetical protein
MIRKDFLRNLLPLLGEGVSLIRDELSLKTAAKKRHF